VQQLRVYELLVVGQVHRQAVLVHLRRYEIRDKRPEIGGQRPEVGEKRPEARGRIGAQRC
jgi:hypothetical protein